MKRRKKTHYKIQFCGWCCCCYCCCGSSLYLWWFSVLCCIFCVAYLAMKRTNFLKMESTNFSPSMNFNNTHWLLKNRQSNWCRIKIASSLKINGNQNQSLIAMNAFSVCLLTCMLYKQYFIIGDQFFSCIMYLNAGRTIVRTYAR